MIRGAGLQLGSWCSHILASTMVVFAAATTAGATAAPKPLLHALGDSTAAGVGARSGSYAERLLPMLSSAGRRFALLNLAESGATTEDVLRDQVDRVVPGSASLVLLGVGVNDLTHDVPPERFAQLYESVIERLRARTAAPIVVSNIPDVSLARAVWPALRAPLAARVDVYDRIIERVALQHGLSVFDACAMTRNSLPPHPEYLSSDGFHPSDAGYQAWAEGLWQVVKRVL
jgi:acyl-CoA thioesterase-1